MPITMAELFDSREITRSRERDGIDLRFGLFGTEDEDELREYLDAALPTSWSGLPLQTYRLTPYGAGVWFLVASYGTADTRALGEVVVSFETLGGSQRITQSLETIYSGKAVGVPGTVPDFKRAINVTQQGVEGVDILAGSGALTFTAVLPSDTVTRDFVRRLLKRKPFVNDAPIWDFASGELLFAGSTGQRRGLDSWEVTWKILVAENVSGLAQPPWEEDDAFQKDGWDYLWVAYEPGQDQSNHIRKGKYIFVERVYPYGDFSTLGIPEGAF